MNLGAGAVMMQDLTRIDLAVADGDARCQRGPARRVHGRSGTAGRVHLIGLVSDGGVHSSIEHLRALIVLGKELGVEDLVIHAFTDGRDTLPALRRGLPRAGRAAGPRGRRRAASARVIGRYYAMDRDKRWERVQLAYDLLVHGSAEHHADSGRAGAARRLRAR